MPAASNDSPCFHCGLPASGHYSALINGESQAFCCVACQAVAQAIAEGGLSDYYSYRDQQNTRPNTGTERFDAYDLQAVQQSFVSGEDENLRRVNLLIGGIHCAACAWLIEHYLAQIVGVSDARVNVSNHRCTFTWHMDSVRLSEVFAALYRIGYRPAPGTDEQSQQLRMQERKASLLRLGVAGLGMMQVGMVAIALHSGNIQGIDTNWQHFLRWVSLLFALPVMFYSAVPFFKSASRALRLGHLNMDVPVSLALVLAFAASVLATINNTGEVYFDSVSMFTFFLLVGRYLEMRARHTSAFESEKLSQLLPVSAERIIAGGRELVPLASIDVGDTLFIAAGDIIPVDGELVSDKTQVDESLLTGESEPIIKKQGAKLYAGSLLAEPAVEMRVSKVGKATRLAAVQNLLSDATQNKPKQQRFADTLARYFVSVVLVSFVAVYGFWFWRDSTQAFWVALSVLVVTCPCALSLATPAALAAGLNWLRRKGLLIVSANALETLPKINHIVFDKTGTLTLGEPSITAVRMLNSDFPSDRQHRCRLSEAEVLQHLAAIEMHSQHPFAQAFKDIVSTSIAQRVQVYPGQGIEGVINGKVYRFGRAEFSVSTEVVYPEGIGWQLFSEDDCAVAWVQLSDAARPHLRRTLQGLVDQGIQISIMSGDRQQNVQQFVAAELSGLALHTVSADLLPEDKLQQLRGLQSAGAVVMMVGDGINDMPVLAAANLSVAMGSASKITQASADCVLLNKNLYTLAAARLFSQRVNRVIKQNFMWALGYNIVAFPAAAMGLIPPYLAAAGMSLSSLVVVLNSLRLGR